ncbi:hypothetical protein [uncultured Aquimarina sp.]|uniref:hypothetical protein n=1 Tax=uncultured Aquimarina sp. TaxID=575652 RepID=UPI0026334FFD|nr:hypothetical protein [uncultured Aquimarina sp.]
MPDIILKYPSEFPDQIIEDDIKVFKSEKLDMKIIKPEPEIYAALEWIIPTSFGVYLMKPYFDAFLKEAGKDHYILLKKGIKNIVSKGKQFDTKILTATASTKKQDKKYNQSLTVSLEVQTKDEIIIKLLFNKSLNKTDWNNAIDQLGDILMEHYTNFPNDSLSSKISEVNKFDKKRIYCVINAKNKKIEFYDDNDLFELVKNKNG